MWKCLFWNSEMNIIFENNKIKTTAGVYFMKIGSTLLKLSGVITVLNGIPRVGIKSLVCICIGLSLWTLGDRFRREY